MPNPSPRQTEEFKKHCYQPKGAVYSDYPLADKPTQVRLAEDITAAVDALGNDKTPWLRRVITEAVRKELLSQAQGTVSANEVPSPPPASPPLDADTLVKVLNEVLAVPRLPAAAKKKLETLLETLSQSQGHLPLG
ncbi:hypothetical protein [Synechococcus sp. C9]|uniref:hypothetical protein n=1 Tax=Synechococcus sp. C9 TaxID=102119 RepID=UPI001FF46F48|nr:hypothetical protein [Synechococcus sp. C9]